MARKKSVTKNSSSSSTSVSSGAASTSSGKSKKKTKKKVTIDDSGPKSSGPRLSDPDSSHHVHHQQFKQRFDANIALQHLKDVCKGNVEPKTAIYMTAVLEYVTTEIAELSCNAARERCKNKMALITQQDVRAAVERDAELKALFKK